MPRVRFTRNLERHLDVGDVRVGGDTVREVLEAVFAENPQLRGYVLDDQSRLRKHVAVFVAGEQVRDRDDLGDAVGPDDEVTVMQALSGG